MNKFSKFYAAPAAFVLTAVAAGQAHAGALADAVTAQVNTAELLLIGGVVLGVAGIILLIRSGKKTAA